MVTAGVSSIEAARLMARGCAGIFLKNERPQLLIEPAGRVTVATQPAGAEVLIDGRREGIAPLTVVVAPGSHAMVIRLGGSERKLPMTVAEGAELTHYVEFAPTPSPVTCASAAKAVLMTVTVGTPRSSSSAASRAVQGVEEPQ